MRTTTADGGWPLPLERYGLIGDAGTAALVSDDGSIDWLCLPRFDSDPVFAAILDPGAGRFSIRPRGPFSSTQRYVDGTAVLRTTFETERGVVAVDDFFAAREAGLKRRGLWPFRYLVRRLVGIAGAVEMDTTVEPKDAFGGRHVRLAARGRRASAAVGGQSILLEAPEPWTAAPSSLATTLAVSAGERRHVAMSFAGRDAGVWPPVGPFAERVYEETVSYWHRWSRRVTVDGERADAIRRSAITLKLLTFAPSGAVVAAPTTSLPEEIGGARNWDYRFAWVRDASWTIASLSELGFADEARAYMTWIVNAARLTQPYVHTLYTLYGGHTIGERTLGGLRGYADSRPVRTGNAAVAQLQLDNWGHVVDAAYVYASRLGRLPTDVRSGIRAYVDYAAANWRRPDQGIWETRGPAEHHVHSKVMCWVALDRGVRLIEEHGLDGPVDRWRRERDAIRHAVLDRGVDRSRGNLVAAFGSTGVDASLLLVPRTGFLPADDDRMLRTIDAVRSDLGEGELLFRYRVDDGVSGGEGAFLACSFWLAEALALAGRAGEAGVVFDAVCRRSNALGLLPEQVDPSSGRFLGNVPQALTHIALINAALALARA